TSNLSGGGGTAFHQGQGLFRATVPSPGGTTTISITYTATDSSGNATNFGPFVIGTPPSPWADLGLGLAGVSGIPSLVGTGPLTPSSANALNLTSGSPSSAALLFVSLSSSPVPFKGGTLGAFPFFAAIGLATNGSGSIPIPFTWPVGVPPGISVYFQYAIADGVAPAGVSLSNLEQGTAQ
ncbi:MAG TPA: hypothetical protein VK824_10910, partial [Planctomycetota bacterium]|nr:hypothetical protein [Planctomycetota bacterium]